MWPGRAILGLWQQGAVRSMVRRAPIVFVIPGPRSTLTGGFLYDKRITEALRDLGHRVNIIELPSGFPEPRASNIAAAEALIRPISEAKAIIVDGLALAALGTFLKELSGRLPVVPLVHHRLALETGLDQETRDRLGAQELAILRTAPDILCSSPATARDLEALGLQADFHVVTPGTDPAPVMLADKSKAETVNLLSVGSVIPRKGYDLLIAALENLPDLPWHLRIVGGQKHAPDTVAALNNQISAAGLESRVELVGEISPDNLHQEYARADCFVLPSRYEGYGMAFTEAVAHGLPVIGTTAGAIPDTVPRSAGVLVAPDDQPALTRTLHQVITDPNLRDTLRQGALETRSTFPTWQDQAKLLAGIIYGDQHDRV